MTDPFSNPGHGFAGPRTEVRRSKDGRPYIWDDEKGKEVLYTRATTFIDCLDDRTMLTKWYERMIVVGLRTGPTELRQRVLTTEPDDKDALNQLAHDAMDAADAFLARQKGTDLHALTEYVDRGEQLPTAGLTEADRADVAAYERTRDLLELEVLGIERFVVVDSLKAAGTYDRLYRYTSPHDNKTRTVIGDLKTGRVDYGQGKLAMQLALYSRGVLYDPATRSRVDQQVDQDLGLIIHLPAGEAECKVYEVDLNEGWAGCLLAAEVREWRRNTRQMLFEVPTTSFDRLLAMTIDLAKGVANSSKPC